MLERFNKTKIRCPVVVYEETNAFFGKKDPKMTKKNKIVLIFNVFINYCQIFDRPRGLECFKGSTIKTLVRPAVFNEEITAMLWMKRSKLTPRMTKSQNLPIFKDFMHFFPYFR